MSAEQGTTDAGGLSRRQLVTRGAIAGGLIWAAPVIRTTAAYATTANGTEKPCLNFYMVVINPDGHVLPAPARTQDHSVPPAIRQWFTDNAGVTVQYPSIKPQLTAVSNEEAAVLLPAVTGPNAAGRQCRLVIGFARKGDKSFSEAFVDPDPPIAVVVGRRIIFPCPRDTSAQSVGGSAVTGSSAVADSTTTSSSTTTTTLATPDAIASQAIDGTAAAPITADNQGGNSQGNNGNGNQDGNSQGNNGNGNGGSGNQGNGNQGGNGSGDQGNGHCFDSLYLIYCCPR